MRDHDPVEDVLEQRLEERSREDDDDLRLAVRVVGADARIELALAVRGERATRAVRPPAQGTARVGSAKAGSPDR